MYMEYIILSWKDTCICANIEKKEFFFLKSKQSCQTSCLSFSDTHTYYGFVIYLVPISARPPFLQEWLGEPIGNQYGNEYFSAPVSQM